MLYELCLIKTAGSVQGKPLLNSKTTLNSSEVKKNQPNYIIFARNNFHHLKNVAPPVPDIFQNSGSIYYVVSKLLVRDLSKKNN